MLAGCVIGLFVSHIPIILPLLKKRYDLSRDCQEAQETLLSTLQDLGELFPNDSNIKLLIPLITNVAEVTMSIDLADAEHSRASQTLGKRRALMQKIGGKLAEDIKSLEQADQIDTPLETIHKFWAQDATVIHEQLRDFTPSITQGSSENVHLKLE